MFSKVVLRHTDFTCVWFCSWKSYFIYLTWTHFSVYYFINNYSFKSHNYHLNFFFKKIQYIILSHKGHYNKISQLIQTCILTKPFRPLWFWMSKLSGSNLITCIAHDSKLCIRNHAVTGKEIVLIIWKCRATLCKDSHRKS